MSPLSPLIEQSRITYVRRKWIEKDMPIYTPEDIITMALDKHRRTQVSWSGGRCSTAVLHMTLQQKPDVHVSFNDTGVAFPETYQYIKRMKKKWNLNLHINKPFTTFWKIVKKHGFPQMRTLGMDKKDRPPIPVCCIELKEKPVKRGYRLHLIKGDIDGLRVAESRVRTFAMAQRGQFHYVKLYRVTRYHPIALWSMRNLNDYYMEHDIPLNPLYTKGHERSGCWCCTAFKDWATGLSKSHPKMYQFMAKKMGITTLDRFLKANVDFEEEFEKQLIEKECDQTIKKVDMDLAKFL